MGFNGVLRLVGVVEYDFGSFGDEKYESKKALLYKS